MPEEEGNNSINVDELVEEVSDPKVQEISRLKDDVKLLKARAEFAEKQMHELSRIREHLFDLTEVPPDDKPNWLISNKPSSNKEHTPVLVTGDFQWGEVINKDNLDNINEYNIGIAETRYKKIIEGTIDIAFEHMGNHKYPGIIYLRLGDGVSGNIHEELRETNEMSSIPAVRSLVSCEAWGLEQLAEKFGKTHVISVPGNHARTSMKPPTKRIEDNYDILSAWWLESLFKKDKRFTWQTPNSADALFPIYGRNYLATHGDNIGSRGGQGFVGPAATILRGMKKVTDEYSRRNIHIEKIFMGHFHTALDVGYGWCNGSLAGYSEYARVNRLTPEPPTQWLIFFHKKYGSTSQWKLRPEVPSKVE